MIEIFTESLKVFNNRELASIVWVLAFVVWIIFYHRVALKGIGGLFNAIIKLWSIFLSMFAYVTVSIFTLYQLSWWDISLLKITIFWLFGWALVTMMSVTSSKKEGYYRRLSVSIIGITAIISFFTNFYTFPFLVELTLLPFIVLVAGMSALPQARTQPKVGLILDGAIILFGIVVLISNGVRAISNLNDFAIVQTLHEFALPILLSFMFLPYLYLLSVFLRYDSERHRKKYLAQNLKKT